MKFEKFITFSIFNALVLLVFASLIASCQKKSIHQTGFFTKYKTDSASRAPASIAPNNIKYTKFNHNQDSKQIYIYCSKSSVKVKQCYEHHFNQILSDFISNHGPIEQQTLASIRDNNKFEFVKKRVNAIQNDILESLDVKLKELVVKREQFCEVNSKINPNRCMNQYLERDSLVLLNAYQFKNNRMNGHEYIYLKGVIKEDLKAKLDLTSEKLIKQLNL